MQLPNPKYRVMKNSNQDLRDIKLNDNNTKSYQ